MLDQVAGTQAVDQLAAVQIVVNQVAGAEVVGQVAGIRVVMNLVAGTQLHLACGFSARSRENGCGDPGVIRTYL